VNTDAHDWWVADVVLWLAQLDWLTAAAWVLTLGCLGCAILDSYTSLCVVGGTLGHIGSKAACPDFGGWDTRVFPLAVDMGWGGALFAVLRLARTMGLRSWRWWVVLVFEVVTAAFTVAGNAFHGAVQDGATSQITGAWMVVISSVASAVPGVVAVGSGFTLSVLVSTRKPSPGTDATGDAVGIGAGDEPAPAPLPRPSDVADQAPAAEPNRIARVAARAEVRRLLRRSGEALTAERVAERTGVSIRHARKLLRQERGETESGRRPRLLDTTAEPAAAAEEA
jgi:hypothetical protein